MVYSPEELLMLTYLILLLLICAFGFLGVSIVEAVRVKRCYKRFKEERRELKAQERFKREWDRVIIPMLNRFSEGNK